MLTDSNKHFIKTFTHHVINLRQESSLDNIQKLLNDIYTYFTYKASLVCLFGNVRQEPDQSEYLINQGYNEKFLEEYRSERIIRIDPVTRFSFQNMYPLTVKEILSQVPPDAQFLRFRDFFYSYGYKNGAVYTYTNPHSEEALYFAFTGVVNEEFDNHAPFLIALAPIVLDAMGALAHKAKVAGKYPKLTQREKEVFKWIMEGKTQWEISKILSVSERTIRFHVSNVNQKLAANNSAHSLAILLQQEIL